MLDCGRLSVPKPEERAKRFELEAKWAQARAPLLLRVASSHQVAQQRAHELKSAPTKKAAVSQSKHHASLIFQLWKFSEVIPPGVKSREDAGKAES